MEPSTRTITPDGDAADASVPTVAVLIPPALLIRTGQRRQVSASGRTVREVIASLDAQYPGLRFNLCHETGELRPFVNIFRDGQNIRYLDVLDTPVQTGACLQIFPSVAGG
jgi:sulfur-carrier protein